MFGCLDRGAVRRRVSIPGARRCLQKARSRYGLRAGVAGGQKFFDRFSRLRAGSG
jgi:hypothetical protein